jgi:arylsulfatase A-like enzyme/tetratricopeptide (TPR) repeat protein
MSFMRRWLLGCALGLFVLGVAYETRKSLKPAPENVLLVSIDTLRADHLGCYGYGPAETPTLDALAKKGLRFEHAATVTPLTLPAHCSLMTGKFPAAHGVRDNGGFYLGDDQTTLATLLGRRGYRTGGFVGAFVLDSRWGIQQGFSHYFDNFDLSQFQGTGMDSVQRRGDEVVDHALEWLEKEPRKPFFCWVHLYDPHTPYEAPEPYRSRFSDALPGPYDAEIAWSDSLVARLLEALQRDGRLSSTYVVVVGDHGESLGEHGEKTHGFFIYDATIRIPLLISGPGVASQVIPDQVRIVDVMPTILDLLHLSPPPDVQGVSLLPLSRGAHLGLEALSETYYPRYHYGWSELTGLRDGRYEFIRAPRRELYDLRDDPSEGRNLSGSEPPRADALAKGLEDFVARVTKASLAGPQRLDPETEERLAALGYVGGTVSRRNLEERPRGDPKDKIGLYNLLKLAGGDSVEGRLDAAIAKVKQAIAADPEIIEAYNMLGNLHVKAKRSPEALAAYRQALAVDPTDQAAIFGLALVYKEMGRLDEAQAGFDRARSLDGHNTKALWQLADVWMRRGRFDKAEAVLKDGLGQKGDRPSFLVKLGECYIEEKRYPEAESELRSALSERKDIETAHYNLALIHEERGEKSQAIEEYKAEVQAHPTEYRANFNLAKLLLGEGRGEDAVSRFEAAVSSNPDFGTGFLYLAKAQLDQGDLEGATASARRGLAAHPETGVAPLGHYVLADVFTRQGRGQDAAREVALARRLEHGG